MDELTSTTPFRSGHTLARVVIALLALGALLDLAGMASGLLQLGLLSRAAAGDYPSDSEATWNDLREAGVGLATVVVYLSTVVMFCVWIYRAYKNLPALGNAPESLEYSPRWAVGYFFIPFANLVMPYRVTKEIWQKSNPVEEGEDAALASLKEPPALLLVWWVVWIASNVANNILFRLTNNAETPESMVMVTKLRLAVGVLDLAAAALAVLVVKGIDDRQEARSRQVTYQTGPPMPPPFYTEQGRPSAA